MKKNLFIVNTPFQCLLAIILKDQFCEGHTDLVITDAMRNADIVVDRIKKTKIFKDVIYYQRASSNLELTLDVFTKKRTLSIIRDHVEYDNLFLCMSGYTEDVINIYYDILMKSNPNLKVFGFVEGYSSYTNEFFNAWNNMSLRHKAINLIARLIAKRQFIKEFNGIYVFHPYLLEKISSYPVIDLADFDMDNKIIIKNKIYDAFNYSPKCNLIPEKYIYFEECFSEDFGSDDDIQIVESIASLVGKENIVIKRHPRNRKDRFKLLGYKTMLNQEIPWEVYALDDKQPEHVLISFSSGAAVNFRFLTSRNIKTILLYKMPNFDSFHRMESDTAKWFEEYCNIYKENVYLPTDIKELGVIVKEIM